MGRAIVVVAFAILAVASVSAQTFPSYSGFPWCRCNDYNATASPVALVLNKESGSPYTAEFSFANVVPSGKPSDCYQKIQNHGIEKIEIQTSTACIGNSVVKVYVNGVHWVGAKVDRAPRGALLRIPFKTFPLSVVGAATTTIRIVGSGACATKEVLFAGSDITYSVFHMSPTATSRLMCCPTTSKPPGSPPLSPPTPAAPGSPDAPGFPGSPAFPPPDSPSFPGLPPLGPAQIDSPPPPRSPITPAPAVPSTFPWCQCRKDAYNTPFYLQLVQPETGANGDLKVNMLVFGDRGCSPEIDACCDMDLHKLEFHINDQCRNHVYGITVGQQSYSASYQSYGANKLVFKITNLGRDLPEGRRYWYDVPEEGLPISFYLRAGPCSNLDTFLADGTSYSFMDKDINCCPTFTFGAK